MIAELGHYALVLALAIALASTVVPLIGAQRGEEGLMRMALPAATLQCLLVTLAFAALVMAFVTSDFSVSAVAMNSHSAKPLIYKISGAWGNHEGSMVLWVLILTLFAGAVAWFGGQLPLSLRARVLAVQSSVVSAFLLFILLSSNPFARIVPAPFEGQGLNPLLQDPALAFHPPFLYAGYVGFSMAFSFAVAALIGGKVDESWARWVRPWTLAAWAFLTIGIAMGSWWAYYELGWGGFWFWDPVENASLLPWLAGTALLHSAIVVEKRGALKSWTILLALLAFSLSLIGTFLVRSGVLTSVHAFATDPERGVFILGIIAFFVGGSFTLFAWRAPSLKGGSLFAPISRESALVLNNLFLMACTATVLIGTLYPLVLETLGGPKITVGPPFFNWTFGPIFLTLAMLVPLGPFLTWKRADLAAAVQRLTAAGIAALVVVAVVYAVQEPGPWLAPLGFGLAAWMVVGALAEPAYRVRLFRVPLGQSLAKLAHLPRSVWGTMLAHGGLGLLLAGIVGATAWHQEAVVALAPGESVEIAGFQLTLEGVGDARGPNYEAARASISVHRGGVFVTMLHPEKRRFPAERQETTETAIRSTLAGDLYAVIGTRNARGEWTLRAYYQPLVPWIWIGAALMTFGGLVSLSDRRYRVGAPWRKRAAARTAQPAPAE